MARKVILVKPPERSRFNFGTFSLGVLAAAVEDIAEVRLLDASRMEIAEVVRRCVQWQADWIGITTMAPSSLPPVSQLVRGLRNALPDGRIVIGGHGASMFPRPTLEAGADAVVVGEGETTFRRLLSEGISDNLPGLALLLNGRLKTTPPPPLIHPLDHLNPPARHLMPPPEDGVHLMETSRGCPHQCGFCETTRFYGRRWRHHSPVRVAAEVRRLVRDYNAWIVEISDDNFAASRRRVLEICKVLRQQEQLPALFILSARADDLIANPGMLPAMAAANMLRISVGVETLDPEVAGRSGKQIPLDTYRQLFDRMRALNMFSVASFIVGLPGETAQIRRTTLDLAEAAGPDAAQFIPFQPFPDLPLSQGYEDLTPARDAAEASEMFTREYYRRPQPFDRLASAAAGNGIRATLARGTLEKYGLL